MSRKKSFRVLIGSCLLFTLLGCATPIHNSFNELKIGDDKDDALEALGNPRHSVRRDGRDYWTYRYWRDGSEYKRTLVFETSKLRDIGPEEQMVDPRDALIEKDLEKMTPDSPDKKSSTGTFEEK